MIGIKQGHEYKVCNQTPWIYKETIWAHGTRVCTGVLSTSSHVGAVLPNDTDISRKTPSDTVGYFTIATPRENTWSLLVRMSSSPPVVSREGGH